MFLATPCTAVPCMNASLFIHSSTHLGAVQRAAFGALVMRHSISLWRQNKTSWLAFAAHGASYVAPNADRPSCHWLRHWPGMPSASTWLGCPQPSLTPLLWLDCTASYWRYWSPLQGSRNVQQWFRVWRSVARWWRSVAARWCPFFSTIALAVEVASGMTFNRESFK